MKNKIFLKTIIPPIILLLTTLTSCLTLSFSKDYKIDRLSYDLINYNSVAGNSNYDSPLLNIKSKEKNDDFFYDNLFNTFHYNILVKNARTVIDSKTSLVTSDNEHFDLTLTTQPTYSISKSPIDEQHPNTYHVDYGQFYTYFPEIIPRHRGDYSYSFIYISDNLANKLISKFNIEGNTVNEKYEKLICDERYCFQNIEIDEREKVPVSINNIIHTDVEEGQSKRMVNLYDDYSLIWANRIKEKIVASFEIELKSNPYSSKKTLKMIRELGYNYENSYFSIKTLINNKYSFNTNASKRLNDALSFKFDFIIFAVFGFIILLSIFTIVIFTRLNICGLNKISLCLCYLLFVVYGFLVTFTYNYPLFSLLPIIYLIFSTILYFLEKKKSKWSDENLFIHGSKYHEIEI